MVNSSVPGTSNFIGEFLILLGFFSLNFFTCLLIMFGSALSLVYSLRALNFIFFGSLPKYNFVNFNLSDISYKEKLCLDVLLFLVLLLGIRPCLVFNIIQSCVKDLLLYY